MVVICLVVPRSFVCLVVICLMVICLVVPGSFVGWSFVMWSLSSSAWVFCLVFICLCLGLLFDGHLSDGAWVFCLVVICSGDYLLSSH